ncbi:MAG: TolB family protein [bacterium]|jgi:hypothetical protein
MQTNRSECTPHPPRPRPAGALLVAPLLGVAIGLAACAASEKTVAPQRPAEPAPRPERVSDVPAPGSPSGTPLIDSALRIDLRPLGSVPTDGFTLPLLSPNGRFMAVQTGTAPDAATALARPGQRAPRASRIALYRIDATGFARLGETDGGFVLGRSADDAGFLIESPRPDGSRWIGRIAWGTDASTKSYEPEWLVQDGGVNAFAALGPDGALAWARREPRSRDFDLMVRRGGSTMRLSGDGLRSYTHPTFAADGSRLFLMVLRDGILELGSVDPTSEEAMQQSLVRAFISDRADDGTAAQMVTPQGTRDGVDGRDLLFFHPMLGSIARWNDTEGLRGIAGGAMAMTRVDARRIAVLDGGRVRVRGANLDPAGAAREPGAVIFEQLAVPRLLGTIDERPALLLITPEAGGVRLLIARLL